MDNYEMNYKPDETSEPTIGVDADYEYEVTSAGGHSNRKKWYYIAGGLLLVVAVSVGAGIGLSGGSGSSSPAKASVFEPAPSPVDGGETPSGPVALNTEVYDIIKDHAVKGGGEVDLEGSYQQKAFQFVDRTYEADAHVVDRLIQRYALASIFYATNKVETRYTVVRFEGLELGPWADSTGWVQAEDECTWKGIVCDEQGWVTELNLGSNVLSGTFPEETKLLKNLLVLDVAGNHCFNSGSEGNDWLGEMTTLQYLYLHRTPFHYTKGIPTALNKLVNLKELDVSYTAYRGELDPNLFADLDQLFVLTMGGNSYNSSIPSTIGRLPELSYMYASNTDIVGDLSFLQSPELWPKLIELWMDSNPRLTGQLPSNIGSYTNIRSLSFADCGLSGPIPESLGDLPLKKFWVYGNKLSGPIPASIANFRNLEYFQVEDNDLTGSIPDLVGFLNAALVNLHADCPDEVTCAQCTCCGPECKKTPLRR